MSSPRAWAAGLAAAILALTLVGCFGTSDCYVRIGAAIGAPVLPAPGGGFVGSCPRWMEIRGEDWIELEYEFAFDADDLAPIGEATRAGSATTAVREMTIYAIDGLDPGDVVAMTAWDGRALIFTRGMGVSGEDLPAALCPRLAPGSERPPDCD